MKIWKLNSSDSISCISCKPALVKREGGGSVSHVDFTVNFVNKTSPATRHAGKFGCWRKCLPMSRERLRKSCKGWKWSLKVEIRVATKQRALTAVGSAFSLKEILPKHSSVMGREMGLHSEVLLKCTVDQRIRVLFNLLLKLHASYGQILILQYWYGLIWLNALLLQYQLQSF